MRKAAALLAVFGLTALFVECGRKERNPASVGQAIPHETLRPLTAFKGEIVFQSDLDGDNEIYLLTAEGVRKLTDNAWQDEFPRWSPDGTKIAYWANPGGQYEVHLMEADGSGQTALTENAGSDISYAGLGWFPDGKRIAYTVEKDRAFGRDHTAMAIDIETRRTGRFLPQSREKLTTPHFSPADPVFGFTGKRLAGWDVALYNFETGRASFVTEGGKACRPCFSKDGRKIAFVSSAADGKGDIWLADRDGSGQVRLTVRDETYDYFPSWSPDGKWIVFCSSTDHYPTEGRWSLLLVSVETGAVEPLFESSRRDLFPDWR
ncbi:MAG: hypothetical protein FJY82_04265 [Candidatus Aminicenantes bacterium]|nr:hypothetical protein [Candidatus Aminicenantes bacterium]